MERNWLICLLIGKYVALGHLTSDSLRYQIDQDLLTACFTPIGQEPGDLDFLDEILGEAMMFVIGKGVNRKQRRG